MLHVIVISELLIIHIAVMQLIAETCGWFKLSYIHRCINYASCSVIDICSP